MEWEEFTRRCKRLPKYKCMVCKKGDIELIFNKEYPKGICYKCYEKLKT